MKYIVYQTTNIINKHIYIGVHLTDDPNHFDGYLGCGIKGENSIYLKHPLTKFHYAVKKYGFKNFKREIIKSFDDAESAYLLEEMLVDEDYLARPDVYNVVLGGNKEIDGIKSIPVYQYDLNGNFITKYKSYHDASRKLHINDSYIGHAVKFKIKCKNYLFSKHYYEKLDISEYRVIKDINTRIYLYSYEGNLIKSYDSINEASRDVKITPYILKKSAQLGLYINNDQHVCFIKNDHYDIARKEYINTRPVYQYDSNGMLITGYSTQLEAEKKYPNSNISKAIKYKSIDSNGFMWGLENLTRYNIPDRPRMKKVGQYDENNNLIKTWESGRQCEREVGSAVRHVLLGRALKHKGYYYKYIYD